MGWWTVRSLCWCTPPLLILGILWLTIPPARPVFGPAFLVIAVPGLLITLVMPGWRRTVHRWEATDDAVYASSGWLWRRWRVVPVSRVQTVDTTQGGLERMFRLARVVLTTASPRGTLPIAGLDHRVAHELAERLARITQATPEDSA